MLFDRPSSPVELFSQLAFQIAPVLLATFLVLPIVLLDCVRFSNRFVGPLFRLSRAMDRLADGDRVHNIEFRQGDFWFSIAQSFNRLNERMIRLDEAAKSRQSGDQYVEAT
jgi:nitrogen fixation/metabolism regulation signal transduction histidine kinase